jgi:cytochrome c-type biogenesis protein CcmH
MFSVWRMAVHGALAVAWCWAVAVGAQAPMAQTTPMAPIAPMAPTAPVVQAVLPGVDSTVLAQADAPMSAPIQARWDHIAAELRCLVCQNESLASSNAELAVDLRREVRSLIEQGQSDADIRSFLVKRYGDFVLYKPEVKPVTWLLWFGPFALLLMALAVALRLMRRTPAAPAPLTESERERARQMLET